MPVSSRGADWETRLNAFFGLSSCRDGGAESALGCGAFDFFLSFFLSFFHVIGLIELRLYYL